MALRNLRKTGQRWLGTPYNGILASQILAETATGAGDDGPGALYNEAQQVEYTGKRLRMRMVSRPTVSALWVEENGAYEAVGLPAGANVFAYYFDVDGVQQSGTANLTITVGSIATISAILADSSFSGGARVPGRATITTLVADSIFSGAALGGGASPEVPAQITATLANVIFLGVAKGSKTLPGQTLSEDDITRICTDIWEHPNALTLQKFLGLK